MQYPNVINQQVFDLIKGNPSAICEFGCAAGAMAAAVKDKFPGVHYVGVDISLDPLFVAREHMDAAIHCDLDSPGLFETSEFKNKIPDGFFDYIIFGDVLEHLKYPEKTLQAIKPKLKQTGRVLISLPNVQHWSVFIQLINGAWPRHDTGIFDRTHLRWFTLKEITNLLESEGFESEEWVARILQAETAAQVANALKPLADISGADFQALSSALMCYQYVLSAKIKS